MQKVPHPHRLRQRRGAAQIEQVGGSPATPGAAAASSRSILPMAAGRPSSRFERPAGDLQMIDIEVMHRVSGPSPRARRRSPIRPMSPACTPEGHRRDLQEGRRGGRRNHHGGQGQATAAPGAGGDRPLVPQHGAAAHHGIVRGRRAGRVRVAARAFPASTRRSRTAEGSAHERLHLLPHRARRDSVEKVYEDEEIFAFHDIHPAAPGACAGHAQAVPSTRWRHVDRTWARWGV